MATSVYVSYSRSAEKTTPILDTLQTCCTSSGLDFHCDRDRLKYGDLIRDFMDKIGSAGNIIPVSSRNYFESEYCMYELLQVWKNGNFHSRIHPICLNDIRLDDADLQLSLIDYWKDKTTELRKKLNGHDPANTIPLQERNTRYAEIYRHINELMAFVSNMNTLSLDELQRQNFLPLINRIQPEKSAEKPHPHRIPDAEFIRTIRQKIQDELKQRENLRTALMAKIQIKQGTNTVDPLEYLCQMEPTEAIQAALRPATEQCLSSLSVDSEDFSKTWEAAKYILGWLSLFSVNPAWIEEQEKRGTLGGMEFDIVVETPCGVEVVSSRYRQMPTQFHPVPQDREVYGKERIFYPLEPGHDLDEAVNKLLLEIWNTVLPEATRTTTLTEKDLRKLNSALKSRERHKTNHYYISVAEQEASLLNNREFCQRLLSKLPSMTIIHLKSTGTQASLRVEDEIDFMTIILEFLTLPHSGRK